MPGDTLPPIGPLPANVGRPRESVAKRWGNSLIFLIVATFALSAFFNSWYDRPEGTVTIVLRDTEGMRSVGTLELPEGSVIPREDVDPGSITTVSARTFVLSDGSVISLSPSGVVRRGENATSVLVASPVAPFLNTPLSVWNDGAQLAWSSPSDGSIQVFVRSARGAYVPRYLSDDLRPNSIGFTEDGASLVVAKIGDNVTEMYAISLGSGKMTEITTIPGFASVVPTP